MALTPGACGMNNYRPHEWFVFSVRGFSVEVWVASLLSQSFLAAKCTRKPLFIGYLTDWFRVISEVKCAAFPCKYLQLFEFHRRPFRS